MEIKKDDQVFHIYGRKEHTRPLEFIKAVRSRGGQISAAELSMEAPGEWVELVAFPEEVIVEVIPGELSHA